MQQIWIRVWEDDIFQVLPNIYLCSIPKRVFVMCRAHFLIWCNTSSTLGYSWMVQSNSTIVRVMRMFYISPWLWDAKIGFFHIRHFDLKWKCFPLWALMTSGIENIEHWILKCEMWANSATNLNCERWLQRKFDKWIKSP